MTAVLRKFLITAHRVADLRISTYLIVETLTSAELADLSIPGNPEWRLAELFLSCASHVYSED